MDHLASSAGFGILQAGGSAADAAIATSAVLAVTTQHMCGMGGDLFALVHDGGWEPAALTSIGHAGAGADAAAMRGEGLTAIPMRGDVRAATVPGCVDGWLALHERFGRLTLREVLAPARRYAADGFPASPLLAKAAATITGVAGADDYLRPGGLRAGDRVRRPLVAAVLDDIVDRGRDGFYGGSFGEGLLSLGAGLFSPDDLARPLAHWDPPLRATAWGHQIWTVPPPSQGYLALAGARIADGLELPDDPADPASAPCSRRPHGGPDTTGTPCCTTARTAVPSSPTVHLTGDAIRSIPGGAPPRPCPRHRAARFTSAPPTPPEWVSR